MNTDSTIPELTRQMIAAGHLFHGYGWLPATGGNFSARLNDDRMLITASGNHKGELREADFLVATLAGQPLEAGRKASYETRLHTQVYRRHAAVGAVLHTHSPANTVLSRRYEQIALSNYELLKVLPGAPDPQATVVIPVFQNDQDIARLSATVDAHMVKQPETPAYLIAGHGLYAWGATVVQARYCIEALEFLLECHYRDLLL